MSTEELSREFLTFTLGHEEYGIEILKVQEIRGYDAVTQIANTPQFIKGVINLRGIIVPIVDMRIKFHLGKVDYDEFTVVIILNVANRVVGMVVDVKEDEALCVWMGMEGDLYRDTLPLAVLARAEVEEDEEEDDEDED